MSIQFSSIEFLRRAISPRRSLHFIIPFAMGLLMAGDPGFAAAEEESADTAMLPAAATRTINFSKDIKLILQSRCIRCHGRGKSKGGFRIDSRETILEGGQDGPALEIGKSSESYLVRLIAGVDKETVMPPEGNRLTPEQVGLIRAWIDTGLEWEPGFTLGRFKEAPLAPHRPDVPPAEDAALSNPIDRFVAPYLKEHGKAIPGPVSDNVFARRASLDVVGLLPSPSELEAFVKDNSPDKREKLVNHFLSDGQGYAENWMSFWNDALRNDFAGTGYIDGGRKQITGWLYQALKSNLPYDEFITQLIHPTEDAEGFIKGIIWRGVVNSSQTPEMQAAQNVSQLFLGINLKCASCHDSFVSNWKLDDSYALASIFAQKPLGISKCDISTGATASVRFLYPELGEFVTDASREARLSRLAEVLTSEKNGRLTRTIVNRIWARFFGRGLVEPVDAMDNDPWNSDLLDWLAWDLSEHSYDLKHTMRLILTSRTYQMPSVTLDLQNTGAFVFEGPVVRRLSAEQFRDALAAVVGVWPATPAADIPLTSKEGGPKEVRAWLLKADPLATAMGRPNREIVVTSRPSLATTLQAVELTNGETLSTLLRQGAQELIKNQAATPENIVGRIYEFGLGRVPTQEEKQVALEMIGETPAPEGVEDLLWAVAMLPDFQLIY
jgi:mono/diheme cytochrome c family protein